MKDNKKGFSLVELIVSFVLLATVSAIICAMLSSGTNLFTRINTRTQLQYKSQVAAVQLQQYLNYCDGGIAVAYPAGDTAKAANSLYIADKSGKKIYAFEYNSTDKMLTFAERAVTVNAGTVVVADASPSPFCNKMSKFGVSFFNVEYSDPPLANAVKYDIIVSDADRTYDKNQIVTFRSKPLLITAPDGGKTLLQTLADNVWGS